MANANLTRDRLLDLIHYDPETGAFTWRSSACRKMRNRPAGNWHPAGYLRIRIDDVMYKAHRLAWLYVYGVWPVNVIDHINGDNSDNRISNLRDVTQKQNMENRKGPSSKSTSGHLGVYWHKQNMNWRAQICSGGKITHIGSFELKEDAIAARKAAEREFFTHSPACAPQSACPDGSGQPGATG